MTDFKASIKIDIHFMGKDYNADMWINWDGPDNRAVYTWLSEVYDDGCARYETENRKRDAERIAAQEDAIERAEYARLKEKYEPFPLKELEKAVTKAQETPRNEVVCTGCNEIATTKDDAGHPLCKDCYDDLDPEAKGE